MNMCTYEMLEQARSNWIRAMIGLPPHLGRLLPSFDTFIGMNRDQMNYVHLEMLLSPHYQTLLRMFALKRQERVNRQFSTTASTGKYSVINKVTSTG